MSTVRLKGRQALTRVLRTPAIYLVPRGDGRVTVGATVEQAGFDKTVEAHAIARLLHAAAQLGHPSPKPPSSKAGQACDPAPPTVCR